MHGNGSGNLGWVYTGPFSELFNLPGNIIQYLFPSTTPALDTTVSEAYLAATEAAAPATEAKQTDWTVADLFEAQAQKGSVASSMLQAASGQQQTTADSAVKCSWYQVANSSGQCSFGGMYVWGLVAAGVVGFLAYRRQ
jgi:hypothetical protein